MENRNGLIVGGDDPAPRDMQGWERKYSLPLQAQSDPVQLINEIRAAQAELGKGIDRRGLDGGQEPAAPVDLERFTTGLWLGWRQGEQRPTIVAPTDGANRSPSVSTLDDPRECAGGHKRCSMAGGLSHRGSPPRAHRCYGADGEGTGTIVVG
jgi:hypothetical protein